MAHGSIGVKVGNILLCFASLANRHAQGQNGWNGMEISLQTLPPTGAVMEACNQWHDRERERDIALEHEAAMDFQYIVCIAKKGKRIPA